MTVISARQVGQYLVNNGCPSSRVVPWVAVSYGESEFNTRAESPVGARGIFQFMPGSWPIECGPYANAWNPDTSALACVILSGGGKNFAPWDSAYRDIYISGRYSFLSWPEAGSADWDLLPKIASMLGTNYHAQIVPNEAPGVAPTLPGALSWYATTTNSVLPRLRRSTHGYAVNANRTY
jgi:hypothetical protein